MQWSFYMSGILCGIFEETNDQIQVRKMDLMSGKLQEKEVFTEETDRYFMQFCSRSLMSFFRNKKEYEEMIQSGVKETTLSCGETFTRRRNEAYYQRNKKFPKDLFFEDGRIYALYMSCREYHSLLVREGYEEKTILAQWKKVYPEEPAGVKALGTFFVETRDGEKLATDVYLPVWKDERDRTFPAVLVRTPYGKTVGAAAYFRFVKRGYAVVLQDTRGREDSTGEWLPNYYEVEDGDDTLNWIAEQTWSDGQAAMTGGSYLGYVQWSAAASGNPHLKAMLSSVCAGSSFVDLPRRGGCFTSGMLAWAFSVSGQRWDGKKMQRDDWDQLLDLRPLEQIPEQALGAPIPFVEKWLRHMDMDEMWERSNWKERYQNGPVPALIMSGWFDDNGMGTTEALDLVRDWPDGTWKAILGPWKHSGNADYDLHGMKMGEDALRYDVDLICMMWLEHFLRGAENGIEKTPAVEYYTLGDDQWKTAESWPPEKTEKVRFYLDGKEKDQAGRGPISALAGTLTESRLTGAAAGAEDSYVYDPENPSVHRIDMSENEIEVPEDYTEEECRSDVLVYSTDVLKEPLTITGDGMVHLFVSCDCPDTDLMVRLTDVDETGRSMKLADGMIDVKYRNDFRKPEYMEAGNIYEAAIRTTKISNTFLPGHRLRLTVTSSAKNFIFPNSNTKDGFNSQVNQKATVTIHRDQNHRSYLEVWKEIKTD